MYDDYHSLMDVHQCVHCLGGLGTNFMSALDLINAYWQLALHDSSQEYTAFTVPGRGKFVWTVTPMGLKTSPSAFSHLMEFVFRGLKNSVIYLDDVLVGSKTWEEHVHHLEDSFCRLQRCNLKLNLKKCICRPRDRISRIHHLSREHKTWERKDTSSERIPTPQIGEGNSTLHRTHQLF